MSWQGVLLLFLGPPHSGMIFGLKVVVKDFEDLCWVVLDLFRGEFSLLELELEVFRKSPKATCSRVQVYFKVLLSLLWWSIIRAVLCVLLLLNLIFLTSLDRALIITGP
jgi:hypothetical protein